MLKRKILNNNRLKGISVQELAEIYLEEGKIEGVRGDVAFAQALKETGYFTYGGDVKPDQHNYTGIGTTHKGVKGHYFDNSSRRSSSSNPTSKSLFF